MRRILIGVALAALCLAATAVAATPTFDGSSNPMPNDLYAVKDTVCSAASWTDTIVPDGVHNYSVTIKTPVDANTAGLWYKLSPSGGPANTGWMLLRDELGFGTVTWPTQVDTVFVYGAGTADTTGITRYQVIIVQRKADN